MPIDAESHQIARDRLEKVFQYLRALHQHRSPVVRQITEQLWHFWLQALPDHPSIRRGRLIQSEATEGAADDRPDDSDRPEDACLLKVRRPQLHRPPPPSESIEDWLQRGWDDPRQGATVRESRNERDASADTRIVRFDE